MIKAKIESLLREKFQPVHLNVIDDSAKHAGHAGALQGGHFTVEITAAAFEGKTSLEGHRLIYAALAGLPIHALAIKIRRGP